MKWTMWKAPVEFCNNPLPFAPFPLQFPECIGPGTPLKQITMNIRVALMF